MYLRDLTDIFSAEKLSFEYLGFELKVRHIYLKQGDILNMIYEQEF
jgi:hypothetical protein